MDEKRLIDLEIKVSHQDLIIEDLHTVIYQQQKQLDQLKDSLKILTQKIKAAAENENEIRGGNEKPPHY